MPNKDKTGPNGKGAMTGRRKGTCTIDKNTKINTNHTDKHGWIEIDNSVLKKKRRKRNQNK